MTLGASIKGLVIILCTIVVAIPSIFGAYGMGMILGGLTLIEKNIGKFVYLGESVQAAQNLLEDYEKRLS